MFGFYKIAVAAPKLTLANPQKNLDSIKELLQEASAKEASILLLSELTLIGYSVGDLLFQNQLLNKQKDALLSLLETTKGIETVVVVGYALSDKNRLYNCAVVIQNGTILGIVPKSFLPNKQEFYESRHFVSGANIKNTTTDHFGFSVPFGVDLLFKDSKELCFGIEICEDLWAVTPPSSQLAINGANLILNLSASNEIIGKAEYRRELVRTQSARAICAYAYASSSLGESSTDTIFSGDLIISEYGSIVAQDSKLSFNNKILFATLDLQRVSNLRISDSSYSQTVPCEHRVIHLNNVKATNNFDRFVDPHPFVPSNKESQEHRCQEITDIQAYALIRRMTQANIKRAVIGISGGLDSTLALLSTHKAFTLMGWDTKDILCYTMPGFGTTSRTKNSAITLCKLLNVTLKEVDITPLALEEFKAIEHNKEDLDVTYENVQARIRTSILMNSANKTGGLVIGTGDLSEIALGWSTYNGDHMSMYALNCGIPKTLIRYIIEYYANSNSNLKEILQTILDTPISPELLPSNKDEISQETESIIGPYELHDFFLYHFVRNSFTPQKILYLADIAFENYSKEEIKKWLKLFIKRFFTQQFKRSAIPDGPMVGTISLSPRANWRMPSDADFSAFLEGIE